MPLAELDKLEDLRILVLSIESMQGNFLVLRFDRATVVVAEEGDLGQVSNPVLGRLDCLIVYPNGGVDDFGDCMDAAYLQGRIKVLSYSAASSPSLVAPQNAAPLLEKRDADPDKASHYYWARPDFDGLPDTTSSHLKTKYVLQRSDSRTAPSTPRLSTTSNASARHLTAAGPRRKRTVHLIGEVMITAFSMPLLP